MSKQIKLVCTNKGCSKFNAILYRRFSSVKEFICEGCKSPQRLYKSYQDKKFDIKAKQELNEQEARPEPING